MGARYGERARCRRCAGWPAGPERRARVPQVWGVAWQAGGSYLASASDDKSVAVYDFS
jgi:WD40 repeat protein